MRRDFGYTSKGDQGSEIAIRVDVEKIGEKYFIELEIIEMGADGIQYTTHEDNYTQEAMEKMEGGTLH